MVYREVTKTRLTLIGTALILIAIGYWMSNRDLMVCSDEYAIGSDGSVQSSTNVCVSSNIKEELNNGY